ncbi:MAG: hypothetical protein ACP5N7_05460, partial [Candidatus Pacearchaeota archaeon]
EKEMKKYHKTRDEITKEQDVIQLKTEIEEKKRQLEGEKNKLQRQLDEQKRIFQQEVEKINEKKRIIQNELYTAKEQFGKNKDLYLNEIRKLMENKSKLHREIRVLEQELSEAKKISSEEDRASEELIAEQEVMINELVRELELKKREIEEIRRTVGTQQVVQSIASAERAAVELAAAERAAAEDKTEVAEVIALIDDIDKEISRVSVFLNNNITTAIGNNNFINAREMLNDVENNIQSISDKIAEINRKYDKDILSNDIIRQKMQKINDDLSKQVVVIREKERLIGVGQKVVSSESNAKADKADKDKADKDKAEEKRAKEEEEKRAKEEMTRKYEEKKKELFERMQQLSDENKEFGDIILTNTDVNTENISDIKLSDDDVKNRNNLIPTRINLENAEDLLYEKTKGVRFSESNKTTHRQTYKKIYNDKYMIKYGLLLFVKYLNKSYSDIHKMSSESDLRELETISEIIKNKLVLIKTDVERFERLSKNADETAKQTNTVDSVMYHIASNFPTKTSVDKLYQKIIETMNIVNDLIKIKKSDIEAQQVGAKSAKAKSAKTGGDIRGGGGNSFQMADTAISVVIYYGIIAVIIIIVLLLFYYLYNNLTKSKNDYTYNIIYSSNKYPYKSQDFIY